MNEQEQLSLQRFQITQDESNFQAFNLILNNLQFQRNFVDFEQSVSRQR